MKIRKTLIVLAITVFSILLFEGCGKSLTSYHGKYYFEYVDKAFYNVIDKAPAIDCTILDGSFNEDGNYEFTAADNIEYEKDEDGIIHLNTAFENVYVTIFSRYGMLVYSIENLKWTPYVVGTDTCEVRYNAVNDPDWKLEASPENLKIMFGDNTISKEELDADYSSNTYSDIVSKVGSIGQLQSFCFSERSDVDQTIRIMWYCPEEQKILTLYFDAKNQTLTDREVSDSEGAILESTVRMTTAEENAILEEEQDAIIAEQVEKLDTEISEYDLVDEDRKKNDSDFTKASVGDAVTFGSYKFENRWEQDIHDCEIDYIYDCVALGYSGQGNYDEKELKARYLTSVCALDNYGCYPHEGIGIPPMVPDDYEYAEEYWRATQIYPHNMPDDSELERFYESYGASYFSTFEEYKAAYEEDLKHFFDNCPNPSYENYDDFKRVFDRYVAEQKGIFHALYTPIKWDVLKIEDDRMLLLSQDVLFTMPFYQQSSKEINSYEQSEIRGFLNNELYNNMFSDAEKAVIVDSEIVNENSAGFLMTYRKGDYDGTGKSFPSETPYENTNEKMFLLGYDEILECYGELDDIEYESYLGLGYERGPGLADLTTKFINTNTPCNWWLRNTNQGEYDKTLLVDENGVIQNAPNSHGEEGGIRPAIWVRALLY